MTSTVNRRLRSLVLLAWLLCCFSTAAAAQQNIQFNVAVTGGTAPVSATVYENAQALPVGATVLAVHGFTETAASWKPLIQALFTHPATKLRVKRVIALDLPGHGNSPIPVLASGLFGNLTIYDNVGVLIQAIDTLRAQGLGPRVLLGHSMGGLEIQAAQEQLLASGSSLAQHGVLRAILLAPVPVANITAWTPASTELPQSYLRFDNGTYIVLDMLGALFGGGFSTTASTPNNPVVTPAAFGLDLTGLIGAEPLLTAAQLVGSIPNLPRPSARQGAFALRNGTLLTVIGFSEDILTPAALQPALYEHLLGRPGLMYQEVVAPDAVHAMFISNPQGMLDQLFDFANSF
jgi:pimeloyl-ACP methyl ester carboxylesterase